MAVRPEGAAKPPVLLDGWATVGSPHFCPQFWGINYRKKTIGFNYRVVLPSERDFGRVAPTK